MNVGCTVPFSPEIRFVCKRAAEAIKWHLEKIKALDMTARVSEISTVDMKSRHTPISKLFSQIMRYQLYNSMKTNL